MKQKSLLLLFFLLAIGRTACAANCEISQAPAAGIHPGAPAPLKGDVNGDGKVDISDIVAVINQIAGTGTYPNSDVNADGKVDISDIVAIINIIASGSISVVSDQKLVVWMKSGKKVYYDLTDRPETTFASGKLILTTDRTTISYNLSDVIKYTYEGTLLALAPSRIKDGSIRYSQGRDSMQFDGLSEGERIELYSEDGRFLSLQEAQGGEPAIVSFSSMPEGNYIVKVREANYKFQKR